MSQVSQDISDLREACILLGKMILSEEDEHLKNSYGILLDE